MFGLKVAVDFTTHQNDLSLNRVIPKDGLKITPSNDDAIAAIGLIHKCHQFER